MTIFTHVAPHPDPLVFQLCEQLATPLDDLFAREVVAVPTRGIERWLTQRIASELADRGIGDGICANVDFPFPHRLIRDVLLSVPDLSASVVAWEGTELLAQVLVSIDEHIDEPWMQLLARYLGVDDQNSVATANRLSAAQKVARLFIAYARRRPDMIRAWAAGDDVGPDAAPIDPGDLWQPVLWRAVRERAGTPSLPELLPEGLDPIRRGEIELDLPARLSVYGLTATDPLDLEVLIALGEHRDVHLYVLHPSPSLWELTSGRTPPPGIVGRDNDVIEDRAEHPLLKVWGRDSRELQTILIERGLHGSLVGEGDEMSDTLLGRLRADIAANRTPEVDPSVASAVIAAADRSVQLHVCHGDRRQAEVMRDAVLHVLAADPSLEARDIAIMTPDLATFTPLLEAAFPSADATVTNGLPDLRLRIADRAPAATNPLVRFTATLLAVADGRLEAGVIRELVTRPVAQHRFGFDNETAGELIGLLDDATIAWGLDSTEREAWGAGTNDERTWSRGLDRMLAGVFYGDDTVRVSGRTAPMLGIEGQEAATAGLMATLLDRLVAVRSMLSAGRPMSQWAATISGAVRLLAAPAWGEDWQLDQLERLLADTFPAPEEGNTDAEITLAEARLAIGSWTDDRPSPLHFRTGDVTVCTLAPMRSVPYKVVCLLGMDEDRFPRGSRRDGDDLLLRHEIVGDHSLSAEDRQLLLDAVMAAEQHLIVTWSGRDELSNAELPPAVPIAELEDTLAEMIGAKGLAALTTTHPLQAFSAQNFTPGRLGADGPWSFDAMHLDAARAIHGTDIDDRPDWLVPEFVDRLRLDDLIAFVQDPAKRFVRERLGFSIPKPDEQASDTLPADLDALGGWSVKERLLGGLVDGHDFDDLITRERTADALPPGDLGSDDLADAVDAVRELWDAALAVGYRPNGHRSIAATRTVNGVDLEGTVSADRARGHLVVITPSRLKGKHRLAAYARMLFLSAIDPGIAWSAVLIGRHPRSKKHMIITIGPIGDTPEERESLAHSGLVELVALRMAGSVVPLALPCETGFGWQSGIGTSRKDAFKKAVGTFENDRFSPEAAEPTHVLLFPELATLAELLDTDFEQLADRLWAPILPLCTEQTL